MTTTILHNDKKYTIDLSKPLDISIPVRNGEKSVNAWYIPSPIIKPVENGNWIAKVSEGASVNFNTIKFNPHSHGTHTESLGHITKTVYDVDKTLKRFYFIARLITVIPEVKGNDQIITAELLEKQFSEFQEALIIRTLPNREQKKSKNYSHTNWPYLTQEAMQWIVDQDIQHLLIDLPSVDKEKDEGKLAAHKTFWGYPNQLRPKATLTELIYVDDSIKDGIYVLNLQVAPFQNDAAPSRPVLYKINES